MKVNDSGVVIRKMTREDAQAVAELDKACFANPWSVGSFEYEAAENPLADYLVAQGGDGSIVGYAGIWNIIDEGHITNVAVRTDFRRKGIAEKMIAELIARSSASGVARFTLEVRVSNEPAQKVYRKFGFTEAGYRRRFYEDNGEDAIIMWKE